jgi:hypothetical protein
MAKRSAKTIVEHATQEAYYENIPGELALYAAQGFELVTAILAPGSRGEFLLIFKRVTAATRDGGTGRDEE